MSCVSTCSARQRILPISLDLLGEKSVIIIPSSFDRALLLVAVPPQQCTAIKSPLTIRRGGLNISSECRDTHALYLDHVRALLREVSTAESTVS